MSMTPAHLEAIGGQVTITWEGQTLLLPQTVEDWDPDALEAFENGKAIGALRSLLGAQYEQARQQFRRDHGRKATVGDLSKIVEAIAEVYGFDSPGE